MKIKTEKKQGEQEKLTRSTETERDRTLVGLPRISDSLGRHNGPVRCGTLALRQKSLHSTSLCFFPSSFPSSFPLFLFLSFVFDRSSPLLGIFCRSSSPRPANICAILATPRTFEEEA